MSLTETYAAHTYHPLPVTLVAGEGSWVTDDDRPALPRPAGRAYSAVNFGHANPRLLAVAHAQLDTPDPHQPCLRQRPARSVLRRGWPTWSASTWSSP